MSRYCCPVRGSTATAGCGGLSRFCTCSGVSSIMVASFAAWYSAAGVRDKAAQPANGPCGGLRGFGPDGLAEVGNGLVMFLVGMPGETAAVVAAHIAGIEAQGLVEVGDGPVVVPFGVPGIAAVDVGHGDLGIDADGLVEV